MGDRAWWKGNYLTDIFQGKAGSFEEDAALKLVLKYYSSPSANKLKVSQVFITGLQNIGMARKGLVSVSQTIPNLHDGDQLNLIMSPFSFGGAFAPFPLELYNELILLSKEANAEPLSFLNVFVDRLTKTDFDLRRDFNPALETRNKSEVLGASFLSSYNQLVNPKKVTNRKSVLNILPYISRRPVSAAVLSKCLSEFLECKITISQHQEKWIKLPDDCFTILSSSQSSSAKLGHDSFLGSAVASYQSKLLFSIFDFDFSLFSIFLDSKIFKQELIKFLKQVLNAPTTCIFRFNFDHLVDPHKSNFSLASDWSRLGKSFWLASEHEMAASDIVLEC
jgi:hypothetical protein